MLEKCETVDVCYHSHEHNVGSLRVLYRVLLKDCVFGKRLKDLKAVFYLSALKDKGAKETPILYSETERRKLGTYSIIN